MSPIDAATAHARLRAELEATLDSLVPPGRPALLVGSGLTNLGDAAIALATFRYLAARDAPVLTMDRRTFDASAARRHLGPDGTLLLAGGGTLGDVWRSQEALRRQALAALPDVAAVQLPQTIHFRRDEAVVEAGAGLRAHPRLTVLVRDEPSLRLARERLGVDARPAPDLAFLLEAPPVPPPTRDIVWLLREDKESRWFAARKADRPLASRSPTDWPRARGARRRWRRLLAASLGLVGGVAARRRAALSRADAALAAQRFAEGVAHLAAGWCVATDRLHGTIFGLLLRRPVLAIPDRHGKVHAFVQRWLSDCRDVTLVGSVEEAAAEEATVAARRREAERPSAAC